MPQAQSLISNFPAVLAFPSRDTFHFTLFDLKLCICPKVTFQEQTLVALHAAKVAESRRLCRGGRRIWIAKRGCNYKSKCFSIQASPSQCHCHFLFIIPASFAIQILPHTQYSSVEVIIFCCEEGKREKEMILCSLTPAIWTHPYIYTDVCTHSRLKALRWMVVTKYLPDERCNMQHRVYRRLVSMNTE